MAMYSISVTPLIHSLNDPCTCQVWFADDATAGGFLSGLIRSLGEAYGYYPNAFKSEFLTMANKVFKGTGVNVTTDRRHHLGTALGCCSFTEQCM